jgi:probable phosphoglycerate mutase
VTPTRVLLWRHGRTAHNHRRVWQGQIDTDLDDVGRAQAARSAAALALVLGDVPVRLVTSDLRRAADTAAALTALTGVAAVPDPRLREVHAGEWEGLSREEIVAAGMADELAAWARGEDIPVGRTGERRSEVGRRGGAAIAEHAATVPAGAALVVASHGGVLRGSILTLLGMAPDRWQMLGTLGNCHWAQLDVFAGAPAAALPAPSLAGALAAPGTSSADSPVPTPQPLWRLTSYNVSAPAPRA